MNSLLDKNTRANLRARNLEEVLGNAEEAKVHLDAVIRMAQRGDFEDAFPKMEDARACCCLALQNLKELLP